MQSVLDPLPLRLGRRSAITGSIRWVIGAFAFAPVQATLALAQEPSGASTYVGAAPQSNAEGNANVPAVARRLWSELLCTCGEADCARPTLALCGCEYAQKERQRIADEVRRLGFGTPERDESTYATVLGAYTAKHGSDATLSAVHQSEWFDNLLTFGVFLAGLAAIIGIAERYRRSKTNPHPGGQTTPPRKRKSGRRRRSWSPP